MFVGMMMYVLFYPSSVFLNQYIQPFFESLFLIELPIDTKSKYVHNIPTAIYYPTPLNKLKIFKSKYKTPISDKISKEVLSLPMSPYLTLSDQKKIVKKIVNFFS